MGQGGFAAEVVGIGALGFDPAGAVLALAAIGAGARRGSLTALVAAYLAAITLLGAAATLAVRTLAGSRRVLELEGAVRAHHLVGVGEVAVGAVLLAAGVVLLVSRAVSARRTRGRDRAHAAEPGETPAIARRRPGALTRPLVLALGGVAVAVSLLADPAFALLAVAARDQPAWQWLPAWLAWGALSQVLLVTVWAAALLDRRGRLLDRVGGAVRAVASHSRVLLAVLLAGAGGYLLVAGVLRLAAVTPG